MGQFRVNKLFEMYIFLIPQQLLTVLLFNL